jgi:Flp pilus assembly pilin Flp
MVEYALLIAGIAIALILAIIALFTAIEGKFNEAATLITTPVAIP